MLVLVLVLMVFARVVSGRRSAIRVALHGLEIATKNETAISLLDLEDLAANMFFAHGVAFELRWGGVLAGTA
jgi:hypothetical protein